MLIITANKPQFNDLKAMAFKKVLNGALEGMEVYLRRQFDSACTDTVALAAIEVAEILGFPDLVHQMKTDFDNAFKKEAV